MGAQQSGYESTTPPCLLQAVVSTGAPASQTFTAGVCLGTSKNDATMTLAAMSNACNTDGAGQTLFTCDLGFTQASAAAALVSGKTDLTKSPNKKGASAIRVTPGISTSKKYYDIVNDKAITMHPKPSSGTATCAPASTYSWGTEQMCSDAWK
jgi:hypothetical protein